MAMVFFMEVLTARTTSAKYGMSRETIRISVLRAKIRNLLMPGRTQTNTTYTRTEKAHTHTHINKTEKTHTERWITKRECWSHKEKRGLI